MDPQHTDRCFVHNLIPLHEKALKDPVEELLREGGAEEGDEPLRGDSKEGYFCSLEGLVECWGMFTYEGEENGGL